MTLREFWMIAGMVIVTFGVRYPVLALVGRRELPPWLLEAMKFIPPAVLTAIIVPAVLMPGGQLLLDYTNAYLGAAIVAAFAAWRKDNLLLTIVLGMVTFWVWRLIL